MRIFGFHDDHACAYYRVKLPFDALRDLGSHEVDLNYGWNERAKDWPIILAQRLSRTNALGIWRRLSLDHRLVYEIDDDLWSIDPLNYSAYRDHDAVERDGAEVAASVAHLVIVSTEPLAEVMRQFNPNVVVCPNHIDGALLDLERPRRDRLTIGWAGGDSHLRDIGMLAPQLKRFLRDNPSVEFHDLGTDYRQAFKLPGRFTGWSTDMWDYYRNIDFDIGLAPLANTTFNRSKSAIKALEYMALGIPVIASHSPAYSGMVVHGETGYLVRQEHEWRRYLRQLVNDEAMREEMGAAGKRRAAEWTIQKGWKLWESAFESINARRVMQEVAS